MLLSENNINQAPPASEPVFDVTTAAFEQRVLLASMEKPVIVDFWAPWCGPCKQLGPLLEKAVRAANGAVLMAKVDIDRNQDLAGALRIQSVPTVYGFYQGRPIDAFQGSLPESQIKAFIDKLIKIAKSAQPDALDIPKALKDAAAALAANNPALAHELYDAVLQQDEKNIQAWTGLVRALIAAGEIDHAKAMVEHAPEDIAAQPGFAEAKTALDIAQSAPGETGLKDLQAALDQNPEDFQARYDLAAAQFSGGAREEAIEHLLYIFARKRDWNDDAARKQLLKFFEALGPADPMTIAGRKKLSSLLFS